MTTQDIYEQLTEYYFNDLRPNAADAKLRDLNENNHHFNTLLEAVTKIGKLSRMAAQDSDDRHSQEKFANRDFVRTMINILPKEYKPFILGKISEEKKRINRDMTAKDLTNILEIYKVPLDEWFRKVSTKNNNSHARVRMIDGTDEETQLTNHNSEDDMSLDIAQIQSLNIHQPTAQASAPSKAQSDCKLCGNHRHNHSSCPLFPPGKNHVAAFECKYCKSGLYHFNKFCPSKPKDDSKN